eukprot:g1379.t1
MMITKVSKSVSTGLVGRVVVARGFASEQEMRKKIESTKNLEKITKSMKMVAASRMRVDETKMMAAKPFGDIFNNVFTPPEDFEAPADSSEGGSKKTMILVNSSDRGLCGGINSYIAKAARAKISELEKNGDEAQLMILGEKGRGQLGRTHPKHIQLAFDEHSKTGITFATCLSIAERVVAGDYDNISVLHNSFRSMIAYDQVEKKMDNLCAYNRKSEESAAIPDLCPPHLQGFEFEPEDKAEALQNLFEFAVAGQVYSAVCDGNAAEQSARMQAMDNASKNAGEMIEKFTLAYNRLRQSKITTELIEIISGAESLKSGED